MRLKRWLAAAVLGAGALYLLNIRKSPYERAVACGQTPSVFRSKAGRGRYEAAYSAMLARWPVEPQSRYVQTRFGATHVLISGPAAAPPLLLLHAVSVSAAEWFRNVEGLSRHFRVYAVDAIGDCGRTRTTALPRDRREYAEWLQEVLFGLGIARTHVLGHSYGGFLAINFALRFPGMVDNLVLLAPAASIHPFNSVVRLLLKCGPVPLFRPSALSTLKRMAHKGYEQDEDFVRLMETVVADCKPLTIFPEVYTDRELEKLCAPVLLLLGDQETIYDPRRAAERARQHISQLRTVIIPDAGHLLNMEQPCAVNREIVSFILDRPGCPSQSAALRPTVK